MLTEIYEFTSDELETPVCMTSGQTSFIVRGNTFAPTAIDRNALRVGTEETPTNALEITLPVNHMLVTRYLQGLQRLEVKVSQINEDQEFTIFNGRVTRLTIERNSAKFIVPTLYSHALQASVPVVRFHRTCNHVLYDDRCKVPKTPPHYYDHRGTHADLRNSSGIPYFNIIRQNGRDLTIANWPPNFDRPSLIGGFISFIEENIERESRSIRDVSGDVITVTYEFSHSFTLAPPAPNATNYGTPLIIAKGCNHKLRNDSMGEGHCESRFNNCRNFGGFPSVPFENQFLGSIN